MGRVHSAEQLCVAPPDVLHTVWGGVIGDEMHNKLRAGWYELRTVVALSLGHSHSLPPEQRNP